jgi:hypothetical protein
MVGAGMADVSIIVITSQRASLSAEVDNRPDTEKHGRHDPGYLSEIEEPHDG